MAATRTEINEKDNNDRDPDIDAAVGRSMDVNDQVTPEALRAAEVLLK